MKWIIALLIPLNCWAGPYVELGSHYTNQLFWYTDISGQRTEESGIIGHAAAGYEIEHGKWLIDFQVRHESDLENSGYLDRTARESAGFAARYRF